MALGGIKPPIVSQPHLGREFTNYKPQENIGGYLALGKVLEVHHKNGTVDIEIVGTGDVIMSSDTNEGRFGARMATNSAHFNSENLTSSGTSNPVQKGQLVILAFLDGMKHEPIIIGTLHNTWENTNNVLSNKYPLQVDDNRRDYREAMKTLNVHPSQFYTKVDGDANVEVSHPCGTFFSMGSDVLDDKAGGYSHDNLSEQDPIRGGTRRGLNDATKRPVNVLFNHQSYTVSYDSPTAHTKVFIDALGTMRLSRDVSDGALSYWELERTGKFGFRRQTDSSVRAQGQDYTEMSVGTDGAFSLSQQKVLNKGKDDQSLTASSLSVSVTGAITATKSTPLPNKGSEDKNNTSKKPTSTATVNIGDDCSINLTRVGEGGSSSMHIASDNSVTFSHQSGSYIKLDSNGDIHIKAAGKIKLNEGG